MKKKNTPGPWYGVGAWVEHPNDDTPDICTCDPTVLGQKGRDYGEILANTALIAAAPDLLDAAVAVVERWDSPDWSDGIHTRDCIDRLRRAIARATGKTLF